MQIGDLKLLKINNLPVIVLQDRGTTVLVQFDNGSILNVQWDKLRDPTADEAAAWHRIAFSHLKGQ
jgi:hypothetical protein